MSKAKLGKGEIKLLGKKKEREAVRVRVLNLGLGPFLGIIGPGPRNMVEFSLFFYVKY